jgi:hypothetical protein
VLLGDHALVSASVRGEGAGGEVHIVADRVVIRGGGLVSASTEGGDSGSILVEAAESLRISNAGGVPLSLPVLIAEGVPGPSGLYAATVTGSGAAGRIDVVAPLVEVADGGIVATSTLAEADAGAVRIQAERVEVIDGGLVDSSSAGAGAAGDVRIEAAESIRIAGVGADGIPSRVRSSATASGAGGDVHLSAPVVMLVGGAVATTTVGATATGDGGQIEIQAGALVLRGGGRVDSGSFSLGAGGRIVLAVSGPLEIAGAGSGVFAETGGAGGGGDVEISAGAIRIVDGGLVSSRSGSAVASAALIFRDAVEGGFIPALRPPPDVATGDAGSVALVAGELDLVNAAIDTEADRGTGGNVALDVSGLVHLDGGRISASVGTGSGGNVVLHVQSLVLESSRIVAQADEGAGGNIAIRTDLLVASPDSEISASARLGVAGTVNLDAPDVDLASSLAALPAEPLDGSGLLRERCAAQRSDAMGSFVVRGREAAPASHAEGLLLALVPSPEALEPTSDAEARPTDLAMGPLPPLRSVCPTTATH